MRCAYDPAQNFTELAERNKFPQTETTVDVINAVSVVRCRECKSHGTLKSGELFCGKIKTGIYGYYHTVKADDYCSYGERKEDRK